MKMTWSKHMNVCVCVCARARACARVCVKKEGAVNRGWRDPPL